VLDQLRRIEPKHRSAGSIRRLKISFAVVTALLVAVILFLSYQLYLSNEEANRGDEAVGVAREFATHITSISHATLEKDMQEIAEVSTTNFLTDFEQATGGDRYEQSLREVEATSNGKVISAALDSFEDATATVVVIVEVTSNNRTLEQPKVETRRLQISLRRTEAGWRVDHLDSAIAIEP